MTLYAHTPNDDRDWHKLEDHLGAVAAIAAEFAEVFGCAELAHATGLWHDLGKASDDFQRYLQQSAGDPDRRFPLVDHKGAGSLAAMAAFEPLAFLIQGHHGGLSDMGNLMTWLKKMQDAPYAERINNANFRASEASLTQPIGFSNDTPPLPDFVKSPLAMEMFLRMLFSCLVDADHLDTEAYRDPKTASYRTPTPDLPPLLKLLLKAQQALTGQHEDAVNTIRHEVYQACLLKAANEPGLFRLTVPTGGGKTRSALAFGLQHAVNHGMRRVIVVSPYLTITDQTADVYREILGDDSILEHHSDAGRHDDPDGSQDRKAEWRRLTAQNWDAAIIVTTAVQFFESLFSNSTMACAKLHRIANSVVILDEPQTLPATKLDPIADGIRQLVQNYGTSVVLCTATQPALNAVPSFATLPPATEIAPDPPRLFRALKRVDYQWPEEGITSDWNEIATNLREHKQVLCILNTRPNALSLLEALDNPEALHLSTLLCPAHRREVLEVIHQRLSQDLPCTVISTQVVEAGVDLDFPIVYRAMGPLDRIAQSAGRCNREGKLDRGTVVVFDPAEGSLPKGPYSTSTDLTRAAMASGRTDADDPKTFERYFRSVYTSVATDDKKIQDQRKAYAFESVARDFQMIPDDSVSVLVRYAGFSGSNVQFLKEQVDHGEILKQLTQELWRSIEYGSGKPARRLWARAQAYVVTLRRTLVEQQLAKQGLATEIAPDLWEWKGGYDEIVGIGRMDAGVWNAESLVIA